MEWFATTAGKCWGCGKMPSEVTMFVNDSNYRYCIDCRWAAIHHHRSECEDFDGFARHCEDVDAWQGESA